MTARGQAAVVKVADAALLSCAVFILYLLTLAANHGEAEDSIRYVLDVTAGVHLFYANHLLYNGLCWIVFEVWSLFGYSGNALLPMQLINAVSGAATIGIIHLMVRRAGFGRLLAAAVALAPAVCYAFWFYSVEAETYLAPMPWVMAAFARLFHGTVFGREIAQPLARTDRGRLTREAVVIALLLCVPTLINQQSVLYFAPASLALMLVHRDRPLAERVRALIVMLSVGAAISLAVYAIVAFGVEGVSSLGAFMLWTLGYAGEGLWIPWSPMSPVKGVIGLIRSVAGGHCLLAYEWVDQLLRSVLPTFPMAEERFLAAHTHPAMRLLAAVATLLAAGLGIAVMLGLALWRTRATATTARGEAEAPAPWPLIPVASTAFAIQAIFAMIWLPQNIEFWITTLPWIFLIVGCLLHRRQSTRLTAAFGAFVLTLGVGNGLGSVLPQTDPDKDYWRYAIQPVTQVARHGDLVLTFGGDLAEHYIEQHAQSEVQPANRSLDQVRARIATFPGRVLISSWVLDPPDAVLTPESDEMRTWDRAGLEVLMKCYEPQLKVLAQSEGQTVWELVAPVPDCG